MKSTLTRITLISILLVLFTPNITFAETKTFIKEYTYQASDEDSKNSCRTIALREVKRILLEELGTYLESVTEVQNFQLTKDQITTLTAGIVKTEIVDEKWNTDNLKYWLKSKIAVDPNEVIKSIDALRKDRLKTTELEEVRRRSDELLKENERLRKELAVAKGEKREEQKTAYDQTIKELAAVELLEKGWALLLSGLGANPAWKEERFNFPIRESQRLEFQKAMDAYNKAIELDPKLAIAYSRRADCYVLLGDFKKALKDYDKAIELDATQAWAYYNRGVVYYLHEEEGQAMRDYDKAIELDPKSAMSYYARGSANLVRGDYQRAINDLNKAIDLDSKYGEAYNNRGNAFYALGKYKQAIEDCNKAIELNPKEAQTYFIRGSAYRRLGDYRKAIEDSRVAAKLGDKQAQAFFGSKGIDWVEQQHSSAYTQKEPGTAVIVCTIEKEWKVPFKLNFVNKTVNGLPANFTDSEIMWMQPMFPEDWGIDESGKKRLDTAWVHVFNRHSGSLNISNVFSGQCHE